MVSVFRKLKEKFGEYRLKYGPLVKLLEKSEKIKRFLENRPLLKPILDDLKPDALTPDVFDDEFWKELASAEKDTEILILSPFLSEDRVNRYLEAIRRAVKNGVMVEIQTLDPEFWRKKEKRQKHQELVEQLKDAGAYVDLRKNMHEKAVIIRSEKKKIAYFGSLNVLSKTELEKGGDYMLKFTNPEIVDALYTFIRTLREHSEEVAGE